MRRRVLAALVVALLAGLVAALIAATRTDPPTVVVLPGTAPTMAPTTAAEQELPFGGAPPVTREPLSLGKLAGDPCTEALTPEQVETAIGTRAVGVREDMPETGPACAWTNHDTGGAIGVSYTLNLHHGLSAVYANTRPKSPVWRVLPDVQGFPAVAHSSDPGLNFCQASIGVRDDTDIDVSLALGRSKRDKADACELVRTIADLTITTLLRAPG